MLRQLMLALLVLTAPSLASADPVPMCGELAQSIEAPPPIYPGREALLGQGHCARQTPSAFFTGDMSLPPQADDSRIAEVPLGYFVAERLPRTPRMRLPMPAREGLELPAGVRREVERPPRGATASLRG